MAPEKVNVTDFCKGLVIYEADQHSPHTVVIRHGERIDNVLGDWQSIYRGYPADDCPLSAKGRKQAERVLDELYKFKPKAIISSPYQRCLATIVPTARYKGWPIKIEPGLGEVLDQDNYPPHYLYPESAYRYYKDVQFDVHYRPVHKPFSVKFEPFSSKKSEQRVGRVVNRLMFAYGLSGLVFVSHRSLCSQIVHMYTGQTVAFDPGTMAFLLSTNNRWVVDFLIQL